MGMGTVRNLVFCAGPFSAGRLLSIVGPAPLVLYDDNPDSAQSMAEIIDQAHTECAKRGSPFEHLGGVAGVAYSAGGRRIRTLRTGQASPGGRQVCAAATFQAYIFADATYASKPPEGWQWEWLKEDADKAKRGEILFAASHITQDYMETRTDGPPFSSSGNVLRMATGFPLAQAGQTSPILTRCPPTGGPNAGLYVYSYQSQMPADAPAHGRQGGPVLEAMAGAHLTPWIGGAARPMSSTPATAGALVPGSILLIGDSLAQGLAAPLGALAKANGFRFQGAGIQSTRIDQWATAGALPAALTSSRPGLVLISLGTNDMRAGDPEPRRADVRTLIERIRGAGAEPAWIAPPTMPFADPGIRAMLAGELAAAGVRLYPSEQLQIPRGPDKIHPTPAGFHQWADAIGAWIPLTGGPPPGDPTNTDTDPGSGGAGSAIAFVAAAALFLS